jgi:hypothetical protein
LFFKKKGFAKFKTIPYSKKLAKFFQISKEDENIIDVKLFLFNDSLCITKSSKKNVPVNTKNNPLDLVTLIKWRSLSTGKKIEISSPDDLTIELTNPKKFEKVAIFFKSVFDRLNWLNEIDNTIKNYFCNKFVSPEYMKIEELSKIDISEFTDLEFQINNTTLLKSKNEKHQIVYHLELHRKGKDLITLNKFYHSFLSLEKYVFLFSSPFFFFHLF